MYLFVGLNIVGGVAILGSYAWGIGRFPEYRMSLWGGVPESWRPLYTVSMFLAAAGYFPITSYLLLVDPGLFGVDGWIPALICYALVLIPSALWLPLTIRHLQNGTPKGWAQIRAVLLLVGLGALGLLAGFLLRGEPVDTVWEMLSVVGLLAFSFQTAVLDGTIWPRLWGRPSAATRRV